VSASAMRAVRVGISVLSLLIPVVSQNASPMPATTAVQPADLLSPTLDANWLTYNGDYSGRRYSSLTQLTRDNVSHLRAEWVFHSRTSSLLEVTPVVVNGVMFITASNDAYALDATTGRTLWHYARPVSEGLIDDASGHINRGVAVLGTRVYMETDNAHLLCLDSRSGHLVWETTAFADFLPPTMRLRASSHGVSGRFQRLVSRVLPAGQGMHIFMVEGPRGCLEPTIQSSIRFTGEPAILLPTLMAVCDRATISTPIAFSRSMPTVGS